MRDYYDSDDDDVFRGKSVRGKATSGSRYVPWELSELEKHMFSWTLQDVLNKNLLKKKVSICLFNLPFYLCQFIKQNRNAYMPVFILIGLHLSISFIFPFFKQNRNVCINFYCCGLGVF